MRLGLAPMGLSRPHAGDRRDDAISPFKREEMSAASKMRLPQPFGGVRGILRALQTPMGR
jgi:hypothetical protein